MEKSQNTFVENKNKNNKYSPVTIITDSQALEGILGGIGWLIAIYQVKNVILKDANPIVSGILTWTVLWYIRKIGMNLYQHYKKSYGYQDDKIQINMNATALQTVFVLILLFSIVTGFSEQLTFTYKDLVIIMLITSVFLVMFLT